MKAEILATGDEIRTGALVDGNSAHIAETLEQHGIEVARHQSVGDDLDTLVAIFHEIAGRAELALVTGGLGPTTDDLSAEAAAKAAGVPLALDEQALRIIEGFFKLLGRPMSESNKKQAFMPEGSERLDNPIGTAPGFTLTIGGCRFFFLPGVPREMRKMLAEQILPRLEKLRGGPRQVLLVRTLATFGATESVIGERVANLPDQFPGLKLGLRAKFPEIQVKFYARGENEQELRSFLDQVASEAIKRLGDRVFSDDGKNMAETVGSLLALEKLSLALAESCTGGLIAHWLTNVPGASDYFRFSGVAYSNESKQQALGVSAVTLERHGAVHEETVKEMAAGARQVADASYALATSGIAGPAGGSSQKPVGTVCIGLASRAGSEGHRFYFPFHDRERNKEVFAMTALDLLRRKLLGLPPPRFGWKQH